LVQVSTIIPTYDAERTIVEAIDSVLSQSFQNHEVLVVNDGFGLPPENSAEMR